MEQGSEGQGAVHKARNAILDQFLPPPLCYTFSHIGGPLKVHHTSRTSLPIFSSSYIHYIHGVCLSSRGFLFGEFCPEILSAIVNLLQYKAKNRSQYVCGVVERGLRLHRALHRCVL